jgi:hypothetical protein
MAETAILLVTVILLVFGRILTRIDACVSPTLLTL